MAGSKHAGRFLGDVVLDFVQGVAHRQLSGELGDGESGRFGRQGRRARHAWVHLDHDQAPCLRIHRELAVGSARLHADLPHDADRGVAQALILAIGQGLRGGHGDRIAGVHPHGVEVFDRADDDHVVGVIPHDLHLEFLPAHEGLFDEDLAVQGKRKSTGDNLFELFDVVGDAAACAAHGERGPDHAGQPDLREDALGVLHGVGDARSRAFESRVGHGRTEQVAVFGFSNHVGFRAEHFDAESIQDAFLGHRQRQVQGGLPAEGGQDRVGPFLFEDALEVFGGQGLDVGRVRHARVGHDRGRVGVDQDDLVPLLLERLAGLSSGVVKLAGLTDHNRSAAQDEDRLDIVAARHS